MKKVLTVWAVSAFAVIYAQTGKPIEFTEVVAVDNKSAKQLYASAKMWFTKTYKNPKVVIQLDDPDNNTVVGRGSYNFRSNIFMGGMGRSGVVKYTVTVACKDGRYKYSFDDIINENSGLVTDDEIQKSWNSVMTGGVEFRKKVSKELRDDVDAYFTVLTKSLREEMDKPSLSTEDW